MVSASRPISTLVHRSPLLFRPAIIFIGPPGSGKGTHGAPLSHLMGLPHVSTGNLLRLEIKNGSTLGIDAKKYIAGGQLVPDHLIFDILAKRLSQYDCKNGYILDGFPRNFGQTLEFEKRFNHQNTKTLAIHLHLLDEEVVERIRGRFACIQCGHPYHVEFDPPKNENQCDYCDGALFRRADDNEETVWERLAVYRRETTPILRYFEQNNSLYSIRATKPKEVIFSKVLDAITDFSSNIRSKISNKR